MYKVLGWVFLLEVEHQPFTWNPDLESVRVSGSFGGLTLTPTCSYTALSEVQSFARVR